MEAVRAERRLVAILAVDIVGYSRLIEADEASTLAAIKTWRSEIFDPLLNDYHGRIVKLMGDGAIVEFGSVVDAVSCAVASQRKLAARQADVPAEHRLLLRMGINLGDVVVDGEDLLGDGVNVAGWSRCASREACSYRVLLLTICRASSNCRWSLSASST